MSDGSYSRGEKKKLSYSKDSILSQEILTAFLLEIVSICKDGARLFAEKDLTRRLISLSRPFKITPDFGGPEKSNQIKSNQIKSSCDDHT